MTAAQNPARIEHDGTYGAQTYGAEPRLGLRELVKVLKRRRSIILGTVAVTTLASAFLAYYLTPQYTATSAISIEPQKTRILNTEAVLEQLPQDPAVIETEVKLLGSRSFAHYAIEALGLLGDPDFNPVLRAQQEKAAAAQVAQAPKQGLEALVAEYIQPPRGVGAGLLAGRDRPRAPGDNADRAGSLRAAGRARGRDRHPAAWPHGPAVRRVLCDRNRLHLAECDKGRPGRQ
jgi:hypothetical protein